MAVRSEDGPCRRQVFLPLWSVVFVAVLSACLGNDAASDGNLDLVEREVNSAWSPDGNERLVFGSRYQTTDLSEPYFNATSATNWSVNLESVSDEADDRQQIGSWLDQSQPGGGVAHGAQFWLPDTRLVVGIEYNTPYVLDLGSGDPGTRSFPYPPQAGLEDAVGVEAALAVGARNAVPSPDGAWLAVSLVLAEEGDTEFDIRFTHMIALFDLRNGAAFKELAVVPFSDRTLDLQLTPPAKEIPFVWTFLWNQESSGVFSISRAGSEAFLISVDGTIDPVNEVPALAVPTRGGVVNDAGLAAVPVLVGNDATIGLVDLAGWVPFAAIELIPLGDADYAL